MDRQLDLFTVNDEGSGSISLLGLLALRYWGQEGYLYWYALWVVGSEPPSNAINESSFCIREVSERNGC